VSDARPLPESAWGLRRALQPSAHVSPLRLRPLHGPPRAQELQPCSTKPAGSDSGAARAWVLRLSRRGPARKGAKSEVCRGKPGA
jgi:hypothetical protein